jgi:hypothetical protein
MPEDGADHRVRTPADNALGEQDGRLVVPASGSSITDEDVRDLRDADQR